MVAQQYGPQVRSDVISDAVQTSFNEAVREQNLRVAGYPRIEPASNAATPRRTRSSSRRCSRSIRRSRSATSASIAIERPQVEVTPADVDRTLDVLRRSARCSSRSRAARETGDRVLVDFTGTIDGVEFAGGQAKDFTITLGEGRMLPEFEAALAGMKAGETKTFPLTFPADYHGKDVAGKDRAVHADGEGGRRPERAAARQRVRHARSA